MKSEERDSVCVCVCVCVFVCVRVCGCHNFWKWWREAIENHIVLTVTKPLGSAQSFSFVVLIPFVYFQQEGGVSAWFFSLLMYNWSWAITAEH